MSERIHGRTYAAQGLSLPGDKKSISPDMQAWINGMDIPDSDMGAKMVSPYMQSTWIYTAVSAMAENLAQIPFRISRVGSGGARRVRALRGSADPRHRELCRRALGESIVESGEVVDLFDHPHPTMDKTLFWEQVVSWDALRGEFFIVPLDEADGVVDLAERAPRVRRMLTLDTSFFWHMVIGYTLEAWRYTGSPLMSPLPSEMLTPSEVIHARSVNPYLYWRGMSPLLVAMLPASADYAASMFMKGLLMNNADTGIIATTEQNLTPEQREQFTAALRERKRKAGTPDRPLFLSSGVKIEKPTISNVDMQFLETRRLLRQEIGAIYKVPESIMGFNESKSSALSGGGAAINEERLSFVQQNIGTKCHRYEAAVDPIIKTFGDDLVGWFDIDSLPIMQDSRRARVAAAAQVFAMGVPLNDINRVYDLGFPEYKWGKVGMLPMNLVSAEQAVEGPELPGEEEPEDGGQKPEDGGQKPEDGKPEDGKPEDGKLEEGKTETPINAALRLLGTSNIQHPTSNIEERKADTAALWRRHVRARAATVKLLQGKVSRVLNEFRAKTLTKLNAVHLEQVKSSGIIAEAESKGLVDLIFSPHEFGNSLRLVLTNPLIGALKEAGEEARREVGVADPWTMPPKQVAEFLATRSQSIMGVGGTVRKQLNTSLEAGYDAGETTAELAARVKATFNELTDGEALRVARTETNMAFETARDKALAAAGIDYKAWLGSHGPNSRPGHEGAELTYIDNPIPSDEPFIVYLNGKGERMMFPGDDSLGATVGNLINCQCIRLAAEKAGEDEKSVTFNVFGLGAVRFLKAEMLKSGRAEIRHCCGELTEKLRTET